MGSLTCRDNLMVEQLSSNILCILPAMSHPDLMLCQLSWVLVEVPHDQSDTTHPQDQLCGESFKQLISQLPGFWPSWPLSKAIDGPNGNRHGICPMPREQNSPTIPMFQRPWHVQSGR